METGSLTQHLREDALGLQFVAEEVAAGKGRNRGDLVDPLVAQRRIEGCAQEGLERLAGLRRQAHDLARSAFGTHEAGAAAVEEERAGRIERTLAGHALGGRWKEARELEDPDVEVG